MRIYKISLSRGSYNTQQKSPFYFEPTHAIYSGLVRFVMLCFVCGSVHDVETVFQTAVDSIGFTINASRLYMLTCLLKLEGISY